MSRSSSCCCPPHRAAGRCPTWHPSSSHSRLGAPGPLARGALSAVRLLGEVQRQEGDLGSYGGDPWLTDLVVTALAGTGSALPPAGPGLGAAGLAYLRTTVQPDGS